MEGPQPADDNAALTEELEALQLLTARMAGDKMSLYAPNAKQWEALVSTAHETLFSGPNQCLAPEQEVWDPVLERRRVVSEIEEDFHVLAWNGIELVPAIATRPFEKDPTDLVEVSLSDGARIRVSSDHPLLGSDGLWTSASSLRPGSGLVRLPTSSERDLAARDEGARRCERTGRGSRSGCRPGRCSCGGRPLGARGAGPGAAPSRACAPERSRSRWRSGAPDSAGVCSPTCRERDRGKPRPHLSSVEARVASLRRGSAGARSSRAREFWTSRDASRVPADSALLRSMLEAERSPVGTAPAFACPLDDPLSVLSVRPLRVDRPWDFVVPVYHSYLLGSTLSHQCGKTENLRFKAACHLSGRYPEDWTGVRFDRPITAAIGGETSQTTRDHLVNPILGDPHERGSGYLPADTFDPDDHIIPLRGVAFSVDYFLVRHETDGVFDGYSKCYVFTYAKGWERLQGYKLDWIGIDEEPPSKVYNELLARTNFTMGYIDVTMSPLKGDTELYLAFEKNERGTQNLITYTIDDATHLEPEKKEFIFNRWKDHPEAEARLYGRPCRGTGSIYPFPDELLSITPFPIPAHWPQIIGLDFPHGVGVFAAARLAIDPESQVCYLVAEAEDENKELPHYISIAKALGADRIPVAWPHDGGITHVDGSTIAERYRIGGLKLLPEPSHYVTPEGKRTFAVMACIEEVTQMMAEQRFRVFSHCFRFFEEKRLYRHKDGKVAPKQRDHLIDAMHKAVMMRRFAKPAGAVLSRGARALRNRNFEFFRH